MYEYFIDAAKHIEKVLPENVGGSSQNSVDFLTSGMRHPKKPLRSNRGLIARCSSVRNMVLVSFC
jgi:hypothetical protein